MVKLIEPLDLILKDILPYLQNFIRSKLGTQNVEIICITKVNDQVQMRDTFPTGKIDMQIEMLDGILASLRAKKLLV